MSRLNNDLFVRRMCQGIVLFILVMLGILQLTFLILVLGRHYSWWIHAPDIQAHVVAILRFPFDQEFASLAAVAAGVVPMVVSAVCFQVDPATYATTTKLNRCGHASIVMLTLGVGLGLSVMAVVGMYSSDVAMMVGGIDGLGEIRVNII